jgi:hypothetical protein
LREQSQSFNVIDVEAGCMTLTVECWSDDAFSPSDARRYEYRNGHWRILKAEAPAH